MSRLIPVLCILSQVVLVMNPGYFNADEIQILEHVRGMTLETISYASFSVYAGGEGLFYRPFGYNGFLLTQWACGDIPQLAHAVSALTHLVSSWLLFLLCRRFAGRRAAGWTALLFCLSPLAVHGVGWIAAIYERLTLVFLLLGLHAFLAFLDGRRPVLAVIIVALSQLLALMSKEVAVIFPFMLVLLALPTRAVRRSLPLVLVLSTGVACFAVWRLTSRPPVDPTTGYVFHLGPNVLENAATYFCYPFSPSLRVSGTELQKVLYSLTGFLLHLACLVVLLRVHGYRITLLLFVLGVLPLLPVLPLVRTQGNYLYIPAAAFAFALGWAWTRSAETGGGWRWAARGLVALSILHCLGVQTRYYVDGHLARRAVASARALVTEADQEPVLLHILPESGARYWVAVRVLGGLKTLEGRKVEFTMEGYPDLPSPKARRVRLLADGSLVR